MNLSLRERLFANYRNPGFSRYLERYSFAPEFMIEAGCHHGEDTLLLVNALDLTQVIAFEPDPAAFDRASLVLRNLQNVRLFPYGLGEASGTFSLFINKTEPENGTSGVGFDVGNSEDWITRDIEVKTLDSVIAEFGIKLPTSRRSCFLWLDVEGFEHKVLKGASRAIDAVGIAQIEMNMHDAIRKANYLGVLKFMYRRGFRLAYAPLHPGYFGDSVFLHQSLIESKKTKARGIFLLLAMVSLHSVIYPMLRKPPRFR
jgi:FkbM family methyltransferase